MPSAEATNTAAPQPAAIVSNPTKTADATESAVQYYPNTHVPVWKPPAGETAAVAGPSQLGKLAEALAKAQGKFTPVPKNKTANAGSFSYKYADLADVLNMALPILSQQGIAVSQPLRRIGGKLYVTTELLHISGEIKASDGLELSEIADPQKLGIKFTYWRRYDLCAMLGIAPDDDVDAQAVTTDGPAGTGATGLTKPVVPSLSKKDESTVPARASRPVPSQPVTSPIPAAISAPPNAPLEPATQVAAPVATPGPSETPPAKESVPAEAPKATAEPTPQEMARVIAAALKEKYPKSSGTLRAALAIMNAVPSIEDLTKTPEGKVARDNSAKFLYHLLQEKGQNELIKAVAKLLDVGSAPEKKS